MRNQIQSFEEAQKNERAGKWRNARDQYREAGAVRSAREMHARYLESLQDELAAQMIRAIVAREETTQ